MVKRQLDVHMQKNKDGPLPQPIYKNEPRIDERANTTKLLEESIGGRTS